jgi:Fe-S-cluster containining protein
MPNKELRTAQQKEIVLPPALTREISEIYQAMQDDYEKIAERIPLTCQGCPDNCCDSYFQHHTYSEWAYLWEGLRQLDDATLQRFREKAKEYVRLSNDALAEGKRPQIMCPLISDDGLCGLYQHRMLVCRMHGVPATLTRPDGQSMRFPGCFRCQEIVAENYEQETDAPAMDRTQLFRRLAALESQLMGDRRHLYPRLKKTIADMIVEGPPAIDTPHCER